MNQLTRNNRIKLMLVAMIAWVAILTMVLPSGSGVADADGGKTTVGAPQKKKKDRKEDPKSSGCLTCHDGSETMHQSSSDFDLGIGCVDCHGGNPEAAITPGDVRGSATYEAAKEKGHVHPRYPESWGKEKGKKELSTRNPERTNALLIRESAEFIRFINPGDLRAAQISCGTANCHPQEVYAMKKSMMTHGAMLWNAALYNNGAVPFKDARYGESYSVDGRPQRIQTVPAPTAEETRVKGILPYLNPLPRYEITQPGNVLRQFERGGLLKGLPSDIGSPDPEEDPGKGDQKLSGRGFGTQLRTDPTFQGLQKTRLLDPLMHFMGTNDQPGDFRSSGCTACHVVYANDRDPVHSAEFAKFGNMGTTETADPTIPKGESGHPIKHEMTNGIPSSQCMICHIHPGGNMLLGYFGMIWWDNETDGEHMYPKEAKKLSPEQEEEVRFRNPEGAAIRGLWGQDPRFLAEIWKEVNPKLKHTQFGDFHGHGWVFRAVYKQDLKGNFLDENDKLIDFNDSDKFKKAVQLRDIHLEKGMHCADCHFRNDSHGNGNIYNEGRAAVELDCIDCHGTLYNRANLLTSGPAAGQGRYNGKVVNKKGLNLATIRTPYGKRLFEVEKGTGDVYQNSMVTKGLRWRVVQTLDSVDPNHKDYKEQSRLAKTFRRDGSWGDIPEEAKDKEILAHSNTTMTCYSCHTSWTTSCFGCHLPMEANKQRPLLHYESETKQTNDAKPSREMFRNWTSYNYQTIRNDIFFLAIDGTVSGHRIAPARSTCAVLVGSQNQLRNWIYSQQQTVSGEGFSGQAFSTFVPHTVRSTESKRCTDCHPSRKEDNNAWLAQVYMQGTNLVNFMFRFAYVATGKHGFEAIAFTERAEPQAVLGSKLHELAYPQEFAKLQNLKPEESHHGSEHASPVAHGPNAKESGSGAAGNFGPNYYNPKTDRYEHRANGSEIRSLQLRGEYLYTANGSGGFRVYDVNSVDIKDFSERLITSPVSPLGQKFYVRSKNATAIASPSTLAVDPTRKRFPENEEGPIHPMYAYLYGTDSEEGLVVIGPVGTLLDGENRNNFIKRAVAYNPEGKLKGARNITIAGTYAYISTDHGLYVVDINDPTNPQITADFTAPAIKNPKAVAVQYRFAYVCDDDGVKVLNVSNLAKPRVVDGAVVNLADARGIYLARTYAYVAAGKDGLAIVDITEAKKPKLDQMFNAGGIINDSFDVKVGMVANSAFALLADGHNGMRVIQILGPDVNEDIYGWSPRPQPRLVATYETEGEALAISKGLDRDRAVDESGNQLAVFNRRGSRPLNKEEMKNLNVVVTNEPPKGKPRDFKRPTEKTAGGEPINSGSNFPAISLLMLSLPLTVFFFRRKRQ
jgi:hypothetical protein